MSPVINQGIFSVRQYVHQLDKNKAWNGMVSTISKDRKHTAIGFHQWLLEHQMYGQEWWERSVSSNHGKPCLSSQDWAIRIGEEDPLKNFDMGSSTFIFAWQEVT